MNSNNKKFSIIATIYGEIFLKFNVFRFTINDLNDLV